MKNKDIRTEFTSGKHKYDVVYRSQITGNLGTFEELRKGTWSEKDKSLAPHQVEPIALRRRHTKATVAKMSLVVDPEGWIKDRCPRCFYISITELAHGRETWDIGNHYPVTMAKVDFGGTRDPRRRIVAKYCDCCDTVFVAGKIMVKVYG